jgi:alkaline phosphatase D
MATRETGACPTTQVTVQVRSWRRIVPDRISRRAFLVVGGAGAASLSVGGALGPARALAGGPSLGGYPFVAGVASGDPRADGVVLWTRLALDPLGERPLPPRPVKVRWQLAKDEGMTRVVREGVATAKPDEGHSVHVELEGLRSGREYWYRFYAAGEASPTGRTRTAPAFGASPATLTFCLASCSQFEHGYFTAYRRMAEDDPSFVVHVGDYIYEYGTDEYLARDGNVRHHVGGETRTLADYRRRYGQYHSDADLQEARRLVPFVTVPDDHEVENNSASGIPEQELGVAQDPVAFAGRRAAALQAYWEWQPLRAAQRAGDGSVTLFRALPFGDLAELVVADTRTFRTDQPCGDEFNTTCAAQDDPAATLPGLPQEAWLVERVGSSRSRWAIIAQQVQMAQQDFTPGDGRGFNPDAWDGYRQSRTRVLRGITQAGARNPVVLTGDVHQHYAADLKLNFDDPAEPIVASEIVATSVTSGGDGSDEPQESLAENPWIHYNANRRGYVRCTVSTGELHADFRVLPTVKQPGAPAATAATFVLRDGVRGLLRA